MTQKFILLIIFTTFFSTGSANTEASTHHAIVTSVQDETPVQMNEKNSSEQQSKPVSPVIPATPLETPHNKPALPHADEEPHIHRYHKERIKKMKQHQGKCWMFGNFLVIVCQLSLLMISFMHLMHA